jgi:hypothetical protein
MSDYRLSDIIETGITGKPAPPARASGASNHIQPGGTPHGQVIFQTRPNREESHCYPA